MIIYELDWALVTLSITDRKLDERTSASTGLLEVGKTRAALPNKFPTSPEVIASGILRPGEPLPGEIVVVGRLMPPDALRKLLSEEEYFKAFARRLSRDAGSIVGASSLLYLAFKGGAGIEKAEDLRTLLDLQYFANLDLITVQQSGELSPEDYISLLRFAERWMEERGLDKSIMPVLLASGDRQAFEELLDSILSRGFGMIGIDLRGGFYYHALRALEKAKRKSPALWIHAFQVPPKIRFGGRLLTCAQGMILPYFGIDSFNRWIVPPPPEPLTKDKINIFDRREWGIFKRKEWREVHGVELGCNCPVCEGSSLEGFFSGKVREALMRGKVHDHYAQREEFVKAAAYIGEGRFIELLKGKKYPKEFLKAVGEA